MTFAGGFGFLPSGYLAPDATRDQIGQTRRSCDRFGVNVFLPGDAVPDAAALATYARELAVEAERYGVVLPESSTTTTTGGARRSSCWCRTRSLS